MDAVLKKHSDGRFSLSHKESGWWIGDSDHDKVKAHKGEQILSKLSLKNCEAIECGYDLDELTENFYERTGYHDFDSHSYKLGFQKALEILVDKKFSEEDLDNFRKFQIQEQNFSKSCLDVWLKSLQQTEWDVEIVGSGTVYKTVLDCCTNHHPKFGCTKKDGCPCISNELPQLDADDCLILKRK